MLGQVARSVIRPMRNARSYGVPSHAKHPTLNELPVPQGSWQAHYDAKNSTYNKELAAGIIFSTVSVGLVIANNWLDHTVWFEPKPKSA